MTTSSSGRPSRLRGIIALGSLCFATGCAWGVPADPGQNARLRSRSSDDGPSASSEPASGLDGPVLPRPVRAFGGDATDDGARAIYLQHCGRCHEPWSPRHASPDAWPGYVRKYGPRAGLFGEERTRVERWLVANSR